MRPKPLIAGNWKMNGTRASLSELRAMADGAAALAEKCEFLICPPATLLSQAAEIAAGSPIAIGAQDCHAKANGAHTGDIAAPMIADAGGRFVIVGHSERRTDHAEDDATVLAKAEATHAAGLIAVVCIGETEAQRVSGETLDVLGTQLSGSVPAAATPEGTVIAYEPVWAIGTGRTPTAADVKEVHDFLRAQLVERFGAEAGAGFRILYGGSVKPQNAGELLGVDNVDGALIGGASLKSDDFLGIAQACPARN